MRKETAEQQVITVEDVAEVVITKPDGATSNTLATVERAVPTPKNPGTVAGYTVGGVGTGFEDFDQNDLVVPLMYILQKGSPQVEEGNPKQIKDNPLAKAGTIWNTATGKLYDGKTGIVVIPVHRVRSFIEWIPKDEGGGLVNVFRPEDAEVQEVFKKLGRDKKYGKLKIGDGNDLVETFTVFCIQVLPDGTTEQVVIPMASSQIGMYQKWMTSAKTVKVDGATPPMFSHRYRLTTFFFSKKDNTWFKWDAKFDGADAEAARLADNDPLFQQAKEFRAMLMAGRARADFSQAEQDGAHEGDSGDQYQM